MPAVIPRVDHDPIRLAVLISGGGTTLANLQRRIEADTLHAEIGAVVCSNAKAQRKAEDKRLGLPIHLVDRKSFKTPAEFSDVVFEHIRNARTDLICLAGFLSLLVIPNDYNHRILNIHPALLPSFGGKGMHGRHVHEAVLQAGCKVTGCTVHFADQTYDTGPILLQRTCPVLHDDTPDTLAARVFEQECEAYPEAIQAIAERRVEIDGRVARVAAQAAR